MTGFILLFCKYKNHRNKQYYSSMFCFEIFWFYIYIFKQEFPALFIAQIQNAICSPGRGISADQPC